MIRRTGTPHQPLRTHGGGTQRRRPAIMVAIRDLDRSAKSLLRKAAALARSHHRGLELVHVIALPYAHSVQRRADVRAAANAMVEDCTRRLTALTAAAELRGLEATPTVVWDYPAAEGLVRQVLQRRPELLLVESHRHARLTRPFLSNTDWELIRKCPCPIWLSKAPTTVRRGPVIAALDPLHAYAKPAALDTVILQHALVAAGGNPARVFACHVYALPAPPAIDGAIEAFWGGMSREEIERYEADLHRQLDRLTTAHRIPPENRLLVRGSPVSILPRVVKKHRASLLVMGAISRTALTRLIIGNTAERVIDALDCDLLVVKPPGFRTDVAPGPRLCPTLGLRTSSGAKDDSRHRQGQPQAARRRGGPQ